MKKYIILLLVLLLVGCGSSGGEDKDPVDEMKNCFLYSRLI
jgi:uncharacterized protein YcfL